MTIDPDAGILQLTELLRNARDDDRLPSGHQDVDALLVTSYEQVAALAAAGIANAATAAVAPASETRRAREGRGIAMADKRVTDM